MKILIVEQDMVKAGQFEDAIRKIKKDYRSLPLATTLHEASLVLSLVEPDLIFMNIEFTTEVGFENFKNKNGIASIVFMTTDKIDTYLNIPGELSRVHQREVGDLLKAFIQEKEITKHVEFPKLVNDTRFNGNEPGIFKKRFLVKIGQKLIPIKTIEINHFYSTGNMVHLVTEDKRKFVIDETLSELENLLDPTDFFRVNRKFIVKKDSIVSLDYYSKGQVYVKLTMLETERIIVSRQQTPFLKSWLNR